jgi:hypothetical protein
VCEKVKEGSQNSCAAYSCAKWLVAEAASNCLHGRGCQDIAHLNLSLFMTTLNEYLVQKPAAWLAKREAARNDPAVKAVQLKANVRALGR